MEKPVNIGAVVRLSISPFEVGYVTTRRYESTSTSSQYVYEVDVVLGRFLTQRRVRATRSQFQLARVSELSHVTARRREAFLKDFVGYTKESDSLGEKWQSILYWIANYPNHKHYVLVDNDYQVTRMSDLLKSVGRRLAYLPEQFKGSERLNYLNLLSLKVPKTFDTVVLPTRPCLSGWSISHDKAAMSCLSLLTEAEYAQYKGRLRGANSVVFYPYSEVS